ncbi:hypothetical protein [Flavobacterium sp.]|jgi:hypothetical protein|uniref:hypothetical protein n=1 Tax=Flavobacterium sp. TaxID=239 RepID=UPI002A7EA5D4|nr:hypothetical protein [Flavobacterium sp.]
MKLFTFITAILITITSCNCQKATTDKSDLVALNENSSKMNQESKVPTMIYEANSRGYFIKLKVENKKIYVSSDREANDFKTVNEISDKDWEEISKLALAVDLNTVKGLKWPTEKRFYDGAAHANITFVNNGVEYPANGFDGGFPPKEIEQLVNKIVELGTK